MNGENYVIKHNNLISLKGRMTTLEQKLLAIVISSMSREDKDFQEYRINVVEFAKCIDSKNKNVYDQLKETAISLRDRRIEIEKSTGKGKGFLVTGWISSAQYIEGEGYMTIYIDPLLRPYLLELKEKFTKYQLKNVLKIKGTHSIRIYELLKQYEKLGKREFLLGELKKILGIEQEYDRIYDFERYVLKLAKEEINQLTDIKIDYNKIKKGRKIEGISFGIQPKLCNEYAEELKQLYSSEEINEIKEKSGLSKENFNFSQIMELYEIACKKTDGESIDPYEYIRINHQEMASKGTARNKFAYLKKSLEEDFASAAIQIKLNISI